LGTGFFVHHKIVSAVKGVKVVGDRMSCIVLRGRWCDITVLNVRAPSEEKSDHSKDSFYKELEQAFYHFPKYNKKILLRKFSAKLRRQDIFKLTIGIVSLYQESDDNGVRIVNV
jgi:hypothetical protein